MSNTITLKKSGVSGNAPSSSDLSLGEIALNYADGHLYYKSEASATPAKINAKDADTTDGFHLNQDVRSTASPTFNGLTVGNHIVPNADNSIDLGTTASKDFRTLYIREIDVFNERLRIDGNGLVARFRDHGSVGDGFQFVHLGSEILRLGNGSSEAATFAGAVTVGGHILPSTSLSYDLGSDSKRFASVFCNGLSAASSVTTPIIQLQSNLKILNKAQTAYLDLATRDTSSSEVVYNLSNIGSVTATSLIKSGGTSSEFLKADGSVDTNTYITTDNNTFRTVKAGNNTLGATETLEFTAGSNVTITESGGEVTIASTDTNTQLSTAQVRSKISGTGLISYNSSTGVISTTANNYSLPEATATVRGGIELFSNTDQSVAANSVSATSGRTYGIQLNSSGQAVVNVPWSDTNTNTQLSTAQVRSKISGTGLINYNSSTGVISTTANNYSHPTHPGDDISIDTGALTGATVISDLDFNITTDTEGHVTDANGTVSTRTLTAANLGIAKPNAPATASAAVVGETVEVTFTASTTSNIDAYLVYSSIDGSDYGLISVVAPDDFSSTMSIIDNAFDETGTQAYRVYAMKHGILSDKKSASVSYTISSLEPTNMSVINLNNAFYIQWDQPSSNARFVSVYNVYKHEHATQGSLSRNSASLVYSGRNTNYMYQISGTNNNNFHQFWVETTIA